MNFYLCIEWGSPQFLAPALVGAKVRDCLEFDYIFAKTEKSDSAYAWLMLCC